MTVAPPFGQPPGLGVESASTLKGAASAETPMRGQGRRVAGEPEIVVRLVGRGEEIAAFGPPHQALDDDFPRDLSLRP